MAKITDKQKRIIESFTCERLCADPANKGLMDDFVCKKGKQLVDYFRDYGWQEDRDSKKAYYIVKNPDDKIVMFFSLQCGALHEPLDEKGIEVGEKMWEVLYGDGKKITDKEWDKLFERQYQNYLCQGGVVSRSKYLNILRDKRNKWGCLERERELDKEEEIIRVEKTHPGIELAHFCVNDLTRDQWKSFGLKHPIGEVMFWMYIAPLIYKIQEKIGCEYAFLFAADSSENNTLVNYYKTCLKFERPESMGTNKPWYDFDCIFMSQSIKMLKDNRELYFDNFNPDDDDEQI